jgi:hypothetical protein
LCDIIQDGNDASCTSGPAPFTCCTGAGTGFCECKGNAACTGFLQPFPCCRIGTGVGNCGDIFQLSEYTLAQCDNGVLESSQTQTAELPVCVIQNNNFDCYQIPSRDAGKAPTCPNCTPTLIDTFTAPGGVTLPVPKPHVVCAPAELTSEPNQPTPDFRGVHLEGYDYPGTTPRSFANIKGVVVTNVFGTITGELKRVPDRLLVPTTKCLPTDPSCTLTPPTLPSIHHFQCYPLLNAKGTGVKATGVTLMDQFLTTTPPGSPISPALKLCVSTNKITPMSPPGGEDPGAVTNPTYLLCYSGGPRFKSATVDLANQFQTKSNVIIDNFDNVCVSSTVTHP